MNQLSRHFASPQNVKQTINLSGPVMSFIFDRRQALWAVVAISILLNVMTLGTSLYMMIIYDKIIPASSVSSLISLFALLILAYVFQAVFEQGRSALLLGVGSGFERNALPLILRAQHKAILRDPLTSRGNDPVRDCDTIKSYIVGGSLSIFMDLPWSIIFILALTIMNLWLGLTIVCALAILIGLSVRSFRITQKYADSINYGSNKRRSSSERIFGGAETIRALGMFNALAARHWLLSAKLDHVQTASTTSLNLIMVISRIFRTFMQSALLTAGAFLVIQNDLSGGALFASSILAGRALGPIDQFIAQWRSLDAATAAAHRLDSLLASEPAPIAVQKLPRPSRMLELSKVSSAPPGNFRPTLTNMTFGMTTGQALGIIGPSGAGKSSLLRTLVGAWPMRNGTIKLDGASFDQYGEDQIGRHIGYLPQTVDLFSGTIAQNVSRFRDDVNFDHICEVAQICGFHSQILALEGGYDYEVGENGSRLSAGQRQRVALIRALIGNPFLIVLDEPNSNLDRDGEVALARAVASAKQRGAIIIVATHRAEILSEMSHLMVMEQGMMAKVGPLTSMITDPQVQRYVQLNAQEQTV